MLLLLMRHGIAEPLSGSGDDAARPLSSQGRDRTRRAAQGLHQLVPRLDVIALSPKLRARQTAELVRDTARSAPPLFVWDELLLEDSFQHLGHRLQEANAEIVLLVGHEPNLSRLVAWILTGSEVGFALDFKKAGVCALDVAWNLSVPTGNLLWMATPEILRKLAR